MIRRCPSVTAVSFASACVLSRVRALAIWAWALAVLELRQAST